MPSAIAFRSGMPGPKIDQLEENYADRFVKRDGNIPCKCEIEYTLMIPNNASDIQRLDYENSLQRKLSHSCPNHPDVIFVSTSLLPEIVTSPSGFLPCL